jgi:hypothetical protein
MILELAKEVKGAGLIREFLISEGVALGRYRKPQLFTSHPERMRIMEEMSDRPKAFRVRSLRRKLTKLDRALTDDEAYALDRAFNAWLALNGKSKSVNPMAVGGGGSSQQEPLNQRELNEATAFRNMRGLLGSYNRFRMRKLFEALAPWRENEFSVNILEAAQLAKAIKRAYEQK